MKFQGPVSSVKFLGLESSEAFLGSIHKVRNRKEKKRIIHLTPPSTEEEAQCLGTPTAPGAACATLEGMTE